MKPLSATEAVSALIRALNDPSAQVRAAAAKGLGKENNTAAVGPLVSLLADRDGAVAVAADQLFSLQSFKQTCHRGAGDAGRRDSRLIAFKP